jgi:hypothetical protein
MRRALVAAALALALAPAAVFAQDKEKDEDDEFDTSYIGARLEYWYRPSMDMQVQVGGQSFSQLAPLGLTGTPLDIQDDLGVTETVESDYMYRNGIFAGEIFIDTRWLSVSAQLTPPFEYRGEAVRTVAFSFGGQQFQASVPVESKFRQALAAVEVKINLLNNRWFRISPLVALHAIGVDWEIRSLGQKGDTSDIDTPLKFDDLSILPYPEVGAEVRLGYRTWIEVDLKASGSYVAYYGIQGQTLSLDAGVTAYPIEWVGVRLGARYTAIDLRSISDDSDEDFSMDVEFLGATLSLIVRFG